MSESDVEGERLNMDREREGLSFWKGMALKTNPPLGLFLEYAAEAAFCREGEICT